MKRERDESYEIFIECLRYSLVMDDIRLPYSFFMDSKHSFLSSSNRPIFEWICFNPDVNDRLALLKRCDISAEDYPILLRLAKCFDENMVSFISNKIKKDKVTHDINKQLLDVAFFYLKDNNEKYFKVFINLCNDINDYVDNSETLLTKVIKELNSEKLKLVLDNCDVDVHKQNKERLLPLMLACEDQYKEKHLEELVNYAIKKSFTFTKVDITNANDKLIHLKDIDAKYNMMKILNNCPTSSKNFDFINI